MRYHLFCLFLFIWSGSIAQYSLGENRIKSIKNSTVKILIDGIQSGTGFFISDKGEVLTCFHVVFSESLRIENQKIVSKIQVATQENRIVDAIIPEYYRHKGLDNARIYDYCLLNIPITGDNSNVSFLKLGNFNDVKEGDWVISCGYPQKIHTPFISSGLFSTKWVDTVKLTNQTESVTIHRNVAWLDLTLNPGNSGGPVILLGETVDDDRVIGIASFILNPYARNAKALLVHAIESRKNIKMSYNGLNQIDINALLSEAIANNSIGVSGCISIEYFKQTR